MKLSFILVEAATPGNVGSAARAIKTMGFESLRLIKPCDYLSKEARKLAYGSHDILESAQIFNSLQEGLHDLDLVIATTAKKRTVWNDYFTPDECVDIIEKKGNTIENIGIVFGREESGLSTEELELCDLRSTVPLAAPYPSINLAQSVMIYAYSFSKLLSGNNHHDKEREEPDSKEQLVLKTKALELLERLEIARNPNLSRRIIERLMQTGEDDIHLFLSFHRFMTQYLDGMKKE